MINLVIDLKQQQPNKLTMNTTTTTTIRYWFPASQQCRYMSFKTYKEAFDTIILFSQIEVKAEVKI